MAGVAVLDALKTSWARVKERRLWPFLLFVATAALAIAGWLAWPHIKDPYVRIAHAGLTLRVSCVPQAVNVRLLTSYARLERARLLLVPPTGESALAQVELEASASREEDGPHLALIVPPKAQATIADAKLNYHPNGIAAIGLEFAKLPALDVTSISIDYPKDALLGRCEAEKLAGSELASRLGGSGIRVMHLTLIQDKLSDLIFGANEVVGNVLLASLIIAFLWLTLLLVQAWTQIYWVPDAKVLAKLRKLLSEALSDRDAKLRSVVTDSYGALHRRLVFCRVLGPALGFLLTVSSLVAGLHPSATAEQDTFRFVSSLQLALVATFMGLAVRIVAEFTLRLHRDLAERKLALLPPKAP